MNRRLLGLLACLVALPWSAPAAQCARGSLVAVVTYVRDGDTIEIGGLPIRLQGLAAPEGSEPGGAEATQAMRAMVFGRELRCELDGERTHDRCVGICYLEGRDISEVMVRRGLARDCPRFSRGRYAEAERHAAAQGCYDRPGLPPVGVLQAKAMTSSRR